MSARAEADCLTENTILAFVEHKVSHDTEARVQRHLARCTACRGIMAEATRDDDEAARIALAPGDRVGRYVVVDLIGVGGMADVYAAHDPELDRKLALKVLRPADPATTKSEARLLSEAKAMARLAHPN